MIEIRGQRRSLTASLLEWSSMRFVFVRFFPSIRDCSQDWQVLCGHVPYDGWETERINDAILQGLRPYKPDAAATLGLVDELWELLRRCWKEKREERPDLGMIRSCLEEIVPLWHVRADLSSTMVDDVDSIDSRSDCLSSPSPDPSPTPSPALRPISLPQ